MSSPTVQHNDALDQDERGVLGIRPQMKTERAKVKAHDR